MKEQEIIRGCIHKDRKSQRAFVDTYSAYMLGVCRRYMSDYGLMKDCLQDSLIQVLGNMDKYNETGKFKSWIAQITVRECLQTIRRNKKFEFFDVAESPPIAVEEEVSSKLELKDVMTFLDSLPVNYRVAINMYIIEGYSHKEIAEKLEITESSSRSLVSRGRKMINELYQKDSLRIVHFNNGKRYSSY